MYSPSTNTPSYYRLCWRFWYNFKWRDLWSCEDLLQTKRSAILPIVPRHQLSDPIMRWDVWTRHVKFIWNSKYTSHCSRTFKIFRLSRLHYLLTYTSWVFFFDLAMRANQAGILWCFLNNDLRLFSVVILTVLCWRCCVCSIGIIELDLALYMAWDEWMVFILYRARKQFLSGQ